VAARHHLENICPVIEKAMADAEMTFPELDAVAVTQGPGLVGALLVGVQVAKGIAFRHAKPLVPVHHIAGHLEAPALALGRTCPCPRWPWSSPRAHQPVRDDRAREYHLLGRTRDDAAGEAFDKVAKLLGLGYPGGPVIDRLSEGANDRAHEFTIARIKDGRPDFSFSGVKTAVLYHVRREGIAPVADPADAPPQIRDLVASFQRAVVTALLRKLKEAAQARRPRSLILTGAWPPTAAAPRRRRPGRRARVAAVRAAHRALHGQRGHDRRGRAGGLRAGAAGGLGPRRRPPSAPRMTHCVTPGARADAPCTRFDMPGGARLP